MRTSELIKVLQAYAADSVVKATWEGQAVEFKSKDIDLVDGGVVIDVDTWGK